MFTGIIGETGILLSVKGGSSGPRLVIGADRILEDIERGDSIAVDGIRLTTASFDSGFFSADAISGTLKRPSLGCPPIESSLSLERAMIADGRFGGHIVLDHIDGTGAVVDVVRDDNALWYTVRFTPPVLRHIIEKGPIVIGGISLTVAQIREQDFSVSLIPHTAPHATPETLRPGYVVSLGNDCVGKYIERFMKISPSARSIEGEGTKNRGTDSRIAPKLLRQCGF